MSQKNVCWEFGGPLELGGLGPGPQWPRCWSATGPLSRCWRTDGRRRRTDRRRRHTDRRRRRTDHASGFHRCHAHVNSLDDFREINRGIPLYADTCLENVNLQLSAANTVQQRRNIDAVEGDGRKTGEVPSDEQRDVRTLFLKKTHHVV